jgi:pimeloyl-ACP methyl ester carboxylesterase
MFEKDVERRLAFKDWTDDDIRSIKAATLIMGADHDVITLEHTVKMSRLISGAKLVILPGTHGYFLGEVCTLTKGTKFPEITASLVEEFLNE